jgi:hypothetical protein
MSNSYFIIHDWMLEELKLKGNDLILFAIIYSFSKSGSFCFNGGREYLAEKSGISIRNLQYMLNSFVESKIIDKTIIEKKKVKYCEYKMADPCKYCTRAKNAPVQKTSKDPCKNCIFTRAKIAYNNILFNISKKEEEEEKMANANNFKVKQYVDLYNSYINNENALFKLYQELHIDVSCIKQLLFIFTYRLNKEKASNALNYIEHFKNWLNTESGQKAIKDIKLSI